MATPKPLAPEKFQDRAFTAKGERRAHVPFLGLKTLWLNTGTLCNITCVNCYIESSPRNDRLAYLTLDDALPYFEALDAPIEIGFTGGEPFMNPDIIALIGEALRRGHAALVLTNAMRPMMRPRLRSGLLGFSGAERERLTLRVSLDHWSAARHDAERGAGGFAKTAAGIDWLVTNGFKVAIAGRSLWGESEAEARAAYADLFSARRWPIDAADPAGLVLFPEMDARLDVPEISVGCWDILGKTPAGVMCAHSRMVVKRRGAARAEVVACTLLPYDLQFSLGETLAEATAASVPLNHPHCAKFCVLGGASCSA